MNKRTFSIATLGCKVNQYESQLMRESLARSGYREQNFKKKSTVHIINTCTVTQKTDKESRRLIRDAQRTNPKATIMVTGCYTEKDESQIRKIPGISFIVKNKDKHRIADILGKIPGPKKIFSHTAIKDFAAHEKAFVKVQDGCDNFCSYCKIPYVRGAPISRPLQDIRGEVEVLTQKGFREIVLCGICLGKWGADLKPPLNVAHLLKNLIEIRSDFRIRLSSIEPYYVSDELIYLMSISDKICKHLHIPLQSGDDEILRMMNRGYTSSEYLGLLENIRKKMPLISITTDVMVGFPGESEEGFKNTIETVKRAAFSRTHIFSYSKRDNTPSANFTRQVPNGIVKSRVHILEKIANNLAVKYQRKFVGKKVKVLVEAKRHNLTKSLTGYTDTYINVVIDAPKPLVGMIVAAKIEEMVDSYVRAKVISNGR